MRHERNKRRKGVVLLMTSLMLLFIVIPIVGLAIDGGIMFTVKAKLQTATDGAALSAARSLSRGLSLAAQQESAHDTAVRYFHANVRPGWMGLSNPQIEVSFPPAPPKTTIVAVETSLETPTYFMRILGFHGFTIRASASANRRDVNIVLVLDRSGSLQQIGACGALREAAKSFVEAFVDGRDRLGLITYGTTYRSDFDPDFDFRSRPGSSDMVSMINNVICIGGTNSAAAYWLAYEKLLGINEPGTLNVIVFFTDGQPNTLHMPALQVKGTSGCVDKSDKNGVIAPAGTQVWGVLHPYENAPPPAPNPDWRAAANSNGCAYAGAFNRVADDIVALTKGGPQNEVDVFGNVLTGYKPVTRDGNGRIRINNAATITNAATNALDNAAARVRAQSAANGLDVITYSVGLGGAPTQFEDEVLNRLANTPESPIYNPAYPTGMYIYAENASQLQQAFAQLASDILRISR